ncbi:MULTISPECIES: hypothetical protein [Serratia]|uniref:hypothetical protein n=1 Tax=Serratia TaxID=613 RepID=UPI0028129E3D|nr:hypothetical protein [Serratia marcescens]MDQ9395346.1 hypothetical protein [Serratia marcescens]MDQ9408003.1 hypothetical protein [Serratia marcescens]MDQ9497895.1 hypothetical protein [Serratia marcescens]MDQ9503076.1 hypothetical protein [Serratia marcescens]MDQ9508487.1 hypothetical protein [Serratia marcescens]
MPIYISLFEPKKKAQVNGAVPLVIALEAPNKRAAESIATGKLYEAYPEGGDNFFNPKTVEDQTGHPRPAVGQFDEKFAAENVFDGNAWAPKEPEPEVPAGPIDLMAQPANVRIAAVVMYGDAEIDDSQLSLVVDLLNDEETPDDTGMRAVIDGLVSVPAVGAMYPASVYKLVSALFQNTTAMPTEEATTTFAQAWVDKPGDRENLTQNSTSTSTSTDNAGVAADYNTLSMHTALSIMGVNPAEAKAADVKNAKEIIANRDNAWRAWDKTLRVIVGILNVETDVRHGIISDGLKNLKLISDDADRLHFVKSRLAGHPACAELANYGKSDEKPVEVANLGGGCFSIDGLIGSGEQQHSDPDTAQSAASNQSEKTEVAQQQVTAAAAAQAKQQLDQMGYGVYANAPAEKSPQLQQAEENADRAETLAQQLKADDFQQRAAQVEQVIAEQSAEDSDNLGIWNRVYKTDAKFTKAFSNNGGGTSINGTYMVMQATKVFGPQGINWGVEIIEERFDNGAPILRPVRQQDGSTIQDIIPNGASGYLCEVNHTVKIRLWYKHGGKTGEVTSYGCTPYIYATNSGKLFSDGEAPKKSLTDATKKALSQLGFSADVFLGLYDDLTYRQENDAEFALKNASEKAGGVTRMREELDEHLGKVADTLNGAVTANEAIKVHGSVAREIEAHRKAAEGNGDKEFAQYLSSRLRRLTALKDERIAALNEEKAS